MSRIDSLRGPNVFAVSTELGRLWEGDIPYDLSEFPASRRAEFGRAIEHWRTKTGLNFVDKTGASPSGSYIKVVEGGGCSSFVGRQDRPQRMSLSSGCPYGAMIHEIGHAIGLFHEQSHPERDQFVRINWANIKPSARYNFRVATNVGRAGPYDYSSIMHYSARAFTNGGGDTITPLQPLPAGGKIGQRKGLSETDIQIVRALYKK
jgi:hypothetical protein